MAARDDRARRHVNADRDVRLDRGAKLFRIGATRGTNKQHKKAQEHNRLMTILQAILLGLVQGLTEFIPISSTAHLVFAARLVNLYGGADKTLQAEQTTATIAVIQLGTLLAVLDLFCTRHREHPARIHHRSSGLAAGSHRAGQPKLSTDAWLGWLVIIGSIPGRHSRTAVEETDRRTLHEKPLGDRDDDDRRWPVADYRGAGGQKRSRHGPARNQRRARGWVSAGAGADSRFESFGFDDHGRVCLQDRRGRPRRGFHSCYRFRRLRRVVYWN